MKKGNSPSENKTWNPVLLIALVLVVLFGVVALTYSWLTKSATAVPSSESSTVENAQIGDFSYTVEYSFDGSTWTNAGTSSDAKGGVEVDFTNDDSSAANHVSKLRFRVRQSGTVKSAVRAKIYYRWCDSSGQTVQGPKVTLTPTMASGWYNNTANDGYYYYSSGGVYVFPQGSNIAIANGFSVGTVESRSSLKIFAMVDGVQFNRFRQVWGIDGTFPGTAVS
ncbi:MAG TPA: hypothetical protein DDY98_05015 [Ruminococcaceae bacterium]|nr:hypothetical protein [Oscillospiraceae bacterium]